MLIRSPPFLGPVFPVVQSTTAIVYHDCPNTRPRLSPGPVCVSPDGDGLVVGLPDHVVGDVEGGFDEAHVLIGDAGGGFVDEGESLMIGDVETAED